MERTNIITSWVLITFLALILALPTQMQAANGDISVPFYFINGLIILEAEVDGTTGKYLLDTGADAILIDGQPKKSDQILVTPEGEVQMAAHQINQIKIGSFIQHGISAHLICLSDLKKQLGIDLDGIIGGSYFMPNTLIMDFEQSIMTISKNSLDPQIINESSAIPFKVENQILLVELEIKGKSHHFAMDSGATVHFIDTDKESEFTSSLINESFSQVITVNQKSKALQRYTLSKFSLGSSSFSGHHCLLQNLDHINKELDLPITGILSLSQLAHDKVIVDFKNNMLYL